MHIDSLTTPAFVIDRSRLERNCEQMRSRAKHAGALFRPHVKTHKTVEIARLQHGGSPGPVTVSTMAEARALSAAGFTDITWAVPLAPSRVAEATALGLHVLFDSAETLEALESFHHANGTKFSSYIKIDCGYHRAGLSPDSPDSMTFVRRAMASPAVRLRGLLTHAGHSYHASDREEIHRIAADELAAVKRVREAVGGELLCSVGSTPTATAVDSFEPGVEIRPGNYVFFDAFQAAVGSCSLSEVAVFVVAEIIGAYPERNQLVLNAGALALSKDTGPTHVDPACGFGVVCDSALRPLPVKLEALSQEHGLARVASGADWNALRPGTRVRIVPNHSCLTAAMFEVYHVAEGERIVDTWRPARGW